MSAHLDIDKDGILQLLPGDLIGQRIAILGISGSGKTNTAAVLIEETLQQGIPLTIVDIEGEYWGLKERYDLLIVGRSPVVDLEIGAEQAASIAEFSLKQRISVILDLSEFKLSDAFEFLLVYFNRLWELASLERKPYGIVLEEASEFIPQGAATPLKDILKTIASRGRKKGLSLMVINQRATTLEKNVLTQSSLLFLHNVRYPSDLKVYEDLIPLLPREVDMMVKDLKPGQAIVLHQHSILTVQIRLRHTFHAGATPGLEEAAPTLRKLDSQMLEQLRQSFHADVPAATTDAKDRKIADLERQLDKSRNQIKDLEALLAAKPVQAPLAQGKPVEVKAAPEPPKSSLQRVTERLDMSAKRRIDRQKESFQKQLAAIKRECRKDQLETLLYLLENEEQFASVMMLARKLGYTEATLSKHPPTYLIKSGWIEKTAGRGGNAYRSMASRKLKEAYPDLNLKDLIAQLHGLVAS